MVSELLLVDAVLVLDLYYNVTRHVTMFLNSNYSMVPFDIPLGRCCQFYMHMTLRYLLLEICHLKKRATLSWWLGAVISRRVQKQRSTASSS